MVWHYHIELLIIKVYRVCGAVCRMQFFLPIHTKLLQCNTLFISHLYCCHILWSTTAKMNLENFFVLRKKMLRITCNLSCDHPTHAMFERCDVIKIFNLYNFTLCVRYQFKTMKNLIFLCDFADLKTSRSGYCTRFVQSWKAKDTRTNYGTQMSKKTLCKLLKYCISESLDLC